MTEPFKTIEGTYDVLPGAESRIACSEAWQHAEREIRAVMHRYAFEEIRTPILEPTGLIARGIGQLTDIVSKEMFSFERGRTSYVLRPELTAPIVRAYLQHHLAQQPGQQRLFYIGPCFRAERPQKGRFRQFHQFGAEILGTPDARADAEVIAVMMAIYDALGVGEVTLRINTLGDAESRPRYREALKAYLLPHANLLTATSRERLDRSPLRILDTKVAQERRLLEDAPRLLDFVDDECLEHYERLKGLLQDLGLPFVEDPFLVRGLDYYSRTAFELEHGGIGAQSALAGGGRYDLLAAEVGSSHPVPAVGFAAGMERLFLALDAIGAPSPSIPPVDAWLIALGEDAQRKAFLLAQELRAAGFRVCSDLRSRSMKSQMRLANRAAARYVVIVGDRELELGSAQVKNMTSGAQTVQPFETLTNYFATETS